MKKTWYFSHDFNAREDEKIQSLICEYGMRGYGAFWAIIEMLYTNEGILQLDCKRIAFALHEEEEFIKSVLEDFNLFVLHDMQIKSASVTRRLKQQNKISQKRSKAAYSRWKPSHANALQTECKSNAIKENKIKENKIKENKISNDILTDICSHFQKEFNSNLCKLTENRRKKLLARLKVWTFEEIQEAITNYSSDDFYLGVNDRKWKADLDFIIRSDEQIEKGINKNRVGMVKQKDNILYNKVFDV